MPRPRILIADDDVLEARELETTLNRWEYDVAGIAQSGREALHLVDQARPDLVLMKTELAGDMDGIEAARRIHERWALPSIYLATFADDATVQRAKLTQPAAYLVAPYSEPELAANIAIALYRHETESKAKVIEKWMVASMQRVADAVASAQTIQSDMLPKTPLAIPGFDIAGVSVPAEAVGGDYFDFIPMRGKQLGLVVADVAGHGFASALVMACTRRALRIFARLNTDLGSVVTALNRTLIEDTDSDHFVTLFLGCLDPATRQLIYVGAGHPAYLFDAEGRAFCLPSSELPLGVKADTRYASVGPIQLQPGQMVVVWTDGLHEARAPNGRIFGLSAVVDYVRGHAGQSARDVLDGLLDAVREYCWPAQPQDDMTVVIIKIGDRPPPLSQGETHESADDGT